MPKYRKGYYRRNRNVWEIWQAIRDYAAGKPPDLRRATRVDALVALGKRPSTTPN